MIKLRFQIGKSEQIRMEDLITYCNQYQLKFDFAANYKFSRGIIHWRINIFDLNNNVVFREQSYNLDKMLFYVLSKIEGGFCEKKDISTPPVYSNNPPE
jgi:hypothetical protein